MYVRKHARPRDERGQFLPGRQLWTRDEGTPEEETRWIRFLQPDGSELRPSLSIDDDALRHLVVLVVVVLVAALLALFVR